MAFGAVLAKKFIFGSVKADLGSDSGQDGIAAIRAQIQADRQLLVAAEVPLVK